MLQKLKDKIFMFSYTVISIIVIIVIAFFMLKDNTYKSKLSGKTYKPVITLSQGDLIDNPFIAMFIPAMENSLMLTFTDTSLILSNQNIPITYTNTGYVVNNKHINVNLKDDNIILTDSLGYETFYDDRFTIKFKEVKN